jgi:hypothetical protein
LHFVAESRPKMAELRLSARRFTPREIWDSENNPRFGKILLGFRLGFATLPSSARQTQPI